MVVRPFHLSLTLTHACNLACTYCCMGEHHVRAMPRATAERALTLAAERASSETGGRLDVGFFGGEPLLEWDTLTATATKARGLPGLTTRLQVTTNGTLVDRERAKTLSALGVRTTVSLDGARASHDATRPRAGLGKRSSHDAVLRGIEALAEVGLFDDVVRVVSPDNVRSLRSDVAYLASLGPRTIHVVVAYDAPFTDADLEAWELELEGLAQDHVERYPRGGPRMPLFEDKIAAAVNGGLGDGEGCSVGRWNVAVAPSGRLYPCDKLVGEDGPRESSRVVGHLDEGIVPSRRLPRGSCAAECGACAERPRCGSTCACANLAETSASDLPGPTQCWHERMVARLSDAVGEALLRGGDPRFSRWVRGDAAVRIEAKLRLPQVRS